MFRIDGPGATQDNKFTEGDPASGARATVVTDEWLNSVQEEIAKAIEGDGYDLDKLDSGQLFRIIRMRTIYRESVAEIEGLSLVAGTSVRLTHERRFGNFLVKTGTPPNDPLKGIYITLANGNYAVRQYGQAVIPGAATKPEWFSDDDIGDGVALASAAIFQAWSLRVPGGSLELNGSSTYLIDASEGTDLGLGRKILCYANGETAPSIYGNGATIKIRDHDISTDDGIMFAGGTANKRPYVSRVNFDMTFTGKNTLATKYPFVGAIWFGDESTGTKTQDELNSDVSVEGCTFKLFHPLGQSAESGNPYEGDPRNGYKMLSVFIDGDSSAQDYDNQNRNAKIIDCALKDGHNGYGFWIWAYNNSNFIRPSCESFVGKNTLADGTVADGKPFIRYHQFYTKGVLVRDINFRAKPSHERTVVGFEGPARAITLKNNLFAAGLEGGPVKVLGGTIIAGHGDAASGIADELLECNCYGVVEFGGGLTIEAEPEVSNGIGDIAAILYAPAQNGGTGYGECHIDVNFGHNLTRHNNIWIDNNMNVEADRRCKLLKVSGKSVSQSQYFLDLYLQSSRTYLGVEQVVLENLTVDQTDSFFGPADNGTRAFRLAASAGDAIEGHNVKVSNTYHEFWDDQVDPGARFVFTGYSSKNTVMRGLGNTPVFIGLLVTGAPGGTIANVGSTATRTDGGDGTTFYVKESGSDGVGWVAK